MKKHATRRRGQGSDKQDHDEKATVVPSTPSTLSFDMVKGNLFRGVHADGVWGGATPQGLLSFTFYSERFPIPQQVTHSIKPDGTLGLELPEARLGREAVVREAEVCVYMNVTVAKAFRDFLNQHVATLEQQMESKGLKRTK